MEPGRPSNGIPGQSKGAAPHRACGAGKERPETEGQKMANGPEPQRPERRFGASTQFGELLQAETGCLQYAGFSVTSTTVKRMMVATFQLDATHAPIR